MTPLFIRIPARGSTTLEPNRDNSVLVSDTIVPVESTTLR